MSEQFQDQHGHEVPRSAQPFLHLITESLNAGLTQAEIQDRIREAKEAADQKPTGIRDDYLRQAIRYGRGEENINPPPQYKYIEQDKSPDPFRLRDATGTTTRQYAYTVAVVELNDKENVVIDDDPSSPTFGQPLRLGHMTISTSQRLSRQRIIDEAQKMVDQGMERYTAQVPSQYRLDIVDALFSHDFLLSAGDNFAA